MSDKDYINEIDNLDTNDPDFLSKLQEISDRVAASRLEKKKQENANFIAPSDPQDLLNCEGCQ